MYMWCSESQLVETFQELVRPDAPRSHGGGNRLGHVSIVGRPPKGVKNLAALEGE
jgi:hypothetical protein